MSNKETSATCQWTFPIDANLKKKVMDAAKTEGTTVVNYLENAFKKALDDKDFFTACKNTAITTVDEVSEKLQSLDNSIKGLEK